MSSYVVDTDLIVRVVRVAFKGKEDGTISFGEGKRTNKLTAEEVAQIIHRENVKSINFLYHERGHAQKINFSSVPDTSDVDATNHVQMLKWLGGIEYNSCEHPGWHRSTAHDAIEKLKEIIIQNMPGYEDAAWTW